MVVIRQFWREYLQCDDIAEPPVLRLVDDTHTAPAESRPEPVASELLTDPRQVRHAKLPSGIAAIWSRIQTPTCAVHPPLREIPQLQFITLIRPRSNTVTACERNKPHVFWTIICCYLPLSDVMTDRCTGQGTSSRAPRTSAPSATSANSATHSAPGIRVSAASWSASEAPVAGRPAARRRPGGSRTPLARVRASSATGRPPPNSRNQATP